jgi:hypothetical protein
MAKKETAVEKAPKVQTLSQQFATPKQLDRPTITEVSDVVRSLRGIANNLEDCLKDDSKVLLLERCQKYEPDLSRLSGVLSNVARELG